jgi:hypothetical protein
MTVSPHNDEVDVQFLGLGEDNVVQMIGFACQTDGLGLNIMARQVFTDPGPGFFPLLFGFQVNGKNMNTIGVA